MLNWIKRFFKFISKFFVFIIISVTLFSVCFSISLFIYRQSFDRCTIPPRTFSITCYSAKGCYEMLRTICGPVKTYDVEFVRENLFGYQLYFECD